MLYYISIDDFPRRKASAIQQVRMCQAFKRAGTDVCLVHPSSEFRKRVHWEELAEYYGLDTEFEVRTVPILDSLFGTVPQVGPLSTMGSMATVLAARVFDGTLDGSDILYGRNYYPLFAANELRRLLPTRQQPTVAFEQHQRISARLKRRFFQSIDGYVTTSHKLKIRSCASFNVDPEGCLVAPHGVELDRYNSIDRAAARKRLNIPQDRPVVAYTGQLTPRKGVETLLRTAPDIDADIYIVGDPQENLERLKRDFGTPANVTFTGFVHPGEIPLYQVAADILVAPYTNAGLETNTPVKIVEYLAAGRPIVVSDKEILHSILTAGEDALYCTPESADSLGETIQQVLNDEELAARLGANAADTGQQYSYQARADRILTYLRNR